MSDSPIRDRSAMDNPAEPYLSKDDIVGNVISQ